MADLFGVSGFDSRKLQRTAAVAAKSKNIFLTSSAPKYRCSPEFCGRRVRSYPRTDSNQVPCWLMRWPAYNCAAYGLVKDEGSSPVHGSIVVLVGLEAVLTLLALKVNPTGVDKVGVLCRADFYRRFRPTLSPQSVAADDADEE